MDSKVEYMNKCDPCVEDVEELLESVKLQMEITMHVFALWVQHVSSGTSVKYEVLQIGLDAGWCVRDLQHWRFLKNVQG